MFSSLACLAECQDKGEEKVCTDDYKNVRCCPDNMVVDAAQREGKFSTCTCTTGTSTKCTSSAVRFGLSLGKAIAAVVFALFLGIRNFSGIY